MIPAFRTSYNNILRGLLSLDNYSLYQSPGNVRRVELDLNRAAGNLYMRLYPTKMIAKNMVGSGGAIAITSLYEAMYGMQKNMKSSALGALDLFSYDYFYEWVRSL